MKKGPAFNEETGSNEPFPDCKEVHILLNTAS